MYMLGGAFWWILSTFWAVLSHFTDFQTEIFWIHYISVVGDQSNFTHFYRVKEELISYFYSTFPGKKKKSQVIFSLLKIWAYLTRLGHFHTFFTLPMDWLACQRGKGPPTPFPFSSFYPPVCKSTLPAVPVV